MNLELQKTLLVELRNLVNSSLKDEKVSHKELEAVLEKNYNLPKNISEEIIDKVAGHEKVKTEDNKEYDEQIRGLISYLGLKPRAYDPQNLDYKKLKTLVNNKISQLNKE